MDKYVCMDCGKTVDAVNEDGECKSCVIETEQNRENKNCAEEE